FALTNKSSAQMAKAIQKIYNDPNDPFNLPKDFIVNKEFEKYAYFQQDAEDFYLHLTNRFSV
ncbi:12651_t:CDS:2, partial [Funneliformis mosseae]